MKPMIWSYFLQLSNHMWDPIGLPDASPYITNGGTKEENGTDIETWDKLIDFIAERKYNMVVIDVGDAIKYESHPEISAPDAWDKDFLKKKLDEIRSKGIEPIPKLNFSTGHCTWLKQYRYMISSPTYYKVCADLIAEVLEAFDYPRLIHVGLDEEDVGHQTTQNVAVVRQGEHWWHDAFFFFKECEKHGARPWVWSDYYWHHPELFKKNMPKSVLQSNWCYRSLVSPPNEIQRVRVQTYLDLDEMGFDQVPTASTWALPFGTNEYETVGWCRDKLNPDLLKGFITVPWCWTQPYLEYFLKNDAHLLFEARKKFYPETLS
ncbi:MAG: Tat pathway signal protein [Clostridia bacterium]|nr:Tat pathway signal protein [Clostridia bacterium]